MSSSNKKTTEHTLMLQGSSPLLKLLDLAVTVVLLIAVWVMIFIGLRLAVNRNEQNKLCNSLVNSLIPVDSNTGFKIYTSNESDTEVTMEVLTPYMNKFPKEFVDNMTERGWKVCLLSNLSYEQQETLNKIASISELGSEKKLASYRGLTVPSSKVIIILMRDLVLNNFDASTAGRVFLHEMGHYLQLEKMTRKECEQWETLYKPLRNSEKWVSVEPMESFSVMFEESMRRGDVLVYSDNEREQFQFVLGMIDKYIDI